MTKDEAMKLALRSIRELVVDESDDASALQGVRMRKQKAEKALREALAQPEQELVGWRVTYSKVIKALAAIVTVHTPDNLFDLDAIPRDPVMGLVQQIRVAIDGYEPPQRKPLTNEQIIASNYPDGEENGPTIATPDFELICFARQVEAAHGIKEKNT